jgi:hypothetical protein
VRQRRLDRGWWWLGAVALVVAPLAAAPAADPLVALRGVWREPPADARPMMRWWWFGPAVTPAGLDRELQAMRDAGLGGVEVQPVYPLVPDDPERGIVNHPYLSKPFLDALRHSAETAKRLGLRFDLTLGSGWPYGGPHIPISRAAGRLRWEKVPVKGRRVPLPAMTLGEKLIVVTLPNGGAELTDIRGDVVWLPEGAALPSEVWVYIAGRTGMMVKRAAVGAEGYVLDHYDRAALQAHLDAVGAPQLDALRGVTPAMLFCDSLEVFGSDWTGDLLPEFERRRGYDLRSHLASLVSGGDARDHAIRHDWGLTLGELYEERFLVPLVEWTRARGSKLRIQGYGIPPATLSSNRFADLTDGEGAAWKTITPSRWASSANHLFDRPVTASETWTWLHSPSFAATPIDLKAEADRHFLQGINQLIGHGWPSTPEGVQDYNWRFYAAGAFNDRNPWWIAMPEIARYLTRASALLRQGQPANDVGLYIPTSDALGEVKPGTAHLLDLVRERVGTVVPGAILEAGFGFDLVDDRALQQDARLDGAALAIGGSRWRVLVLPAVRTMPLATLRKIEAFVAAGGIVVAIDRAPEAIPGLRVSDADRAAFAATAGRVFGPQGPVVPLPVSGLTAALRPRLTPDVRVEPAAADFGHAHRRVDGAEIYFLANTANTPLAAKVTVRARGRAEWWDPVAGTMRPADVVGVGADTMTLELALDAYGSTFLIVAAGPPPRPARTTSRLPAPIRVPVAGPWTVTFPEGHGPARALTAPASWDADDGTRFFSGVATYATTVDLPAIPKGGSVVLDFGEGKAVTPADKGPGMRTWFDAPVRDAATVTINDQPAGAVWTPPFRLDVTPHARAGANRIVVRVGNTPMNHMAGRPLPEYRLLVLRYGDRFQPQNMELVRPLPSGLLGPVTIAVTPPR